MIPGKRDPQPLQVILSRKNIEITGTLLFEDETVSHAPIDSMSLRGAQRELTGRLVKHGYTPVGRWSEGEEDDDGYTEWTRTFKPGPHADNMLVDNPMPDRQPDPA